MAVTLQFALPPESTAGRLGCQCANRVGLVADPILVEDRSGRPAGVALGFGKKVWGELEPDWVKRVAAAIDPLVSALLADYRKRYAKHLYYRPRTCAGKEMKIQKFKTVICPSRRLPLVQMWNRTRMSYRTIRFAMKSSEGVVLRDAVYS